MEIRDTENSRFCLPASRICTLPEHAHDWPTPTAPEQADAGGHADLPGSVDPLVFLRDRPAPPWSAVLAPLGSPGVDGRQLDAAFEVEARAPLPLFLDRLDGGPAVLLGRVSSVVISDAMLTATGTLDVWYPDVAGDIARGDLVPSFMLAPYEKNDAGHIIEGRVCEVRLLPRDQAVWPEASIAMLDSHSAFETLLARYGTIDPQRVKAAGGDAVEVGAAERLAARVDAEVATVTDAEVDRRLHDAIDGAVEQLVERAEHARRLCDGYKDQPPPIFRGPGLSERGEGYNQGVRDMARAVLSYLDGTAAEEDTEKLIDAARAARANRYAVALNALGAGLADVGRFATLTERRRITSAVLAAIDAEQRVDQAPARRFEVHATHQPQWSQRPEFPPADDGPGVDSWCGRCHVTLFSPIDGITDAGAAPCSPPPPAPVSGQLTVSPLLPADGWPDVDQAGTICGQVERVGSRFADVDGPGQALVLVRLPDGTPVMGAAPLHLFVAGARNLRPASDR
ncbi:hypothetical protein [Micromonospora sp. NPDC049645]|uniref:hypothetical protein n=1 Tax=Micromonospora sp. NPDC049645 TaxID=3155508 RepID=UPI00343C2D0E